MTVKSDVPNPLVHKVTLNPGNEVRKAKTKLDEVLDERETRAAQRYSAATLEQMAIDAENEVARARGEPPKYKHGGEGMSEEERQKQEEQRERMMDSAKALIDSGIDPRQVGQMLMGLAPTPATGFPQVQGMGFDEVIKIVNLVVGKKETDEIKSLMTSLDKKIDEVSKGGGARVEISRPLTPMEMAKQQAEYIATLKELGLIKEPVTMTEKGESLEVVKERNRHDERMEEVKAEADYKKTLSQTVSELPERIGRGIAGQITEEEGNGGSGGSNSGDKLSYIICSEEGCGAKIYTPPGTKQATCPKCGSIYQPEEAPETK